MGGSQWGSFEEQFSSRLMRSEVVRPVCFEEFRRNLSENEAKGGGGDSERHRWEESFARDSLFTRPESVLGFPPEPLRDESRASGEAAWRTRESFKDDPVLVCPKSSDQRHGSCKAEPPRRSSRGCFFADDHRLSKTKGSRTAVQRVEQSKRERGHYRICSQATKEEAVRLSQHLSLKQASEMLRIPEKNIKRWMRHGPSRKKGTGKTVLCSKVEDELAEWVLSRLRHTGRTPAVSEMIACLSQHPDFANLRIPFDFYQKLQLKMQGVGKESV